MATDGTSHRFRWENGTLTDLGVVEDYTAARDLNNRGDVVGTFRAEPDRYPCTCRAGLWRDGVLTDLGSLGTVEAWMQSFPTDVNNRGTVVGASVTAREEEHAFLWRDGVMRDLGTLGGPGSRANAINDRDMVVGFAEVSESVSHPFLWRGGVLTDLTGHGLAATDELSDINDRGQLAGNRAGRATLFR